MSNLTMSASVLATVRPGASAWDVLEAEYDLLHAEVVVVLSAEEQAEAEDDDSICGIVNRHEFYKAHEADNARFDCGFWGDHPVRRSHCGAKAKRTMIRKRGRV